MGVHISKWSSQNQTAHSDSSDLLLRSHRMRHLCGYCKLRVHKRYATATLTGATANAEDADYPKYIGTPACSSHSSTALCYTYITHQGEFGCVVSQDVDPETEKRLYAAPN